MRGFSSLCGYVFTKPGWLVDLLKAVICHDHNSSACPPEHKLALERLSRLAERGCDVPKEQNT